ncbi:MAG: hypothetical protein LBQ75_10475 [Zoogloeaceae bacterium]|jgi:type IV pilus assembly protein PilY1|nr:hypothetical protein [Zoogloeaceae bacterium]
MKHYAKKVTGQFRAPGGCGLLPEGLSFRAAVLFLGGALFSGLALSQGASDLEIAQRPLTSPALVSPNLVYIHDDSGSMAWSYMPDDAIGPDRTNTSFSSPGNVDESDNYTPSRSNSLLSVSWNGMYYNPEMTYQPPFKWDSGKLVRMPNSDTLTRFPRVRKDGYTDNSGYDDLGVLITSYVTPQILGNITHPNDRTSPPLTTGVAIYWDYVPGYNSMRDNPTYDRNPNARPEDNQRNYEHYAFKSVPSGFLFRTNRDTADTASRTATANRLLVVQRACPTILPDVVESREYYGNDNPHGQCRVTYRTNGVTSTAGVGRGTAAFANTSGTSYNGRPWCVRSVTYNARTNGSTTFGTISTAQTTPLVWQPYAANGTAPAVSCYAGRHVIGDTNGDGMYDANDNPKAYVSYFQYSEADKKGATSASSGNTQNCLMVGSGHESHCTNLYGPEQSRLHLVTSHVDDKGELVEYSPRRRTGEEEIRNFMNWYTYYRSRAMSAKAGMSIAFAQLVDRNDTTKPSAMMNNQVVRLGYDTINSTGLGPNETTSGLGPDNSNKGGKGVRPFLDSPQGYGQQQFVKDFYNWVLGLPAPNGGTYLNSALKAVGNYYMTDKPWMDNPPAPGNPSGSGAQNMSGCRRSFAVLMTDGYNNTKFTTGCATLSSNSYCYDNKEGPDILKPDGSNPYRYKPEPPFANPDHQNTLADWAMHYWNRDLRSDIPNHVAGYTREPSQQKPTAGNPAFWQHMQTFTIGLGAQGTLSSRELKEHLGKKDNWGNPANDANRIKWNLTVEGDHPSRIDDLFHTGINGHGDFFDARDANEFANGLKEILVSMAGEPASHVSYGGAGGRSADGDDFAYLAEYNPTDWSGNVYAYPLCTTDTIDAPLRVAPGSSAVKCSAKLIGAPLARVEWNASDKLKAQLTPAGVAARKVFTWDGTFEAPRVIVDNNAGKNTAIVNYLRGDASQEQAKPDGSFRNRDPKFLGDIVNATPYLLGAYEHNDYGYGGFRCDVGRNPIPMPAGASSDSGVTCANEPSSFLSREQIFAYRERLVEFWENGRPTTIFAAANDGMLHAFAGGAEAEGGGRERFAYVPGAVHRELAELTKPGYAHQYYVDGTPWVGDILLEDKWRSVLVGSTGRANIPVGGAISGSYFALDVENPEEFSANDVLWEFTDENLGAPADGEAAIVAIPGGLGTQWVAVFGNGYNSRSGRVGLFIVPLEKNPSATFIEVPRDRYDSNSSNGLATPYLLDKDGDGRMDLAFAGDVQGNLWKFNLANPGETPEKLLEARDSSGKAQPITAPPTLICLNPQGRCTAGYQLVVGTGKFFSEEDVRRADHVQSTYGIRLDQNGETRSVARRESNNLQARVYVENHPETDEFFRDDANETRKAWKLDPNPNASVNPTVDYATQNGYVIDLSERGMNNPVNSLVRVQGTVLVPKTRDFLMPLSLPSADACSGSLAGGVAEFNYEHGTWIKSSLFKRIQHGSNLWFEPGASGAEVNRDGKYLKSDIRFSISGQSGKKAYAFNMVGGARYGTGIHDAMKVVLLPTPYPVEVGGLAGRRSWRQLR